ncbi:MAG: hypothetical protein PQJ61_07905 [Spirochaetales bacterium]|uniref:Uncharacterized protein n=1 Tax=Candidatus Thalassospirochaeta sargassi TaxID=3119039 RepID=A0AAJ1IEH0_9SPIO|nr:hypothetical protein [Spirochaetales bacterium]
MAKIKKMCKAAKDDFKENEAAIIEEVSSAKYICRKCLRTASNKKLLCDPKKITSE